MSIGSSRVLTPVSWQMSLSRKNILTPSLKRRDNEASDLCPLLGVCEFSSIQCFNAVGWEGKGHLARKSYLALFPRYSLR